MEHEVDLYLNYDGVLLPYENIVASDGIRTQTTPHLVHAAALESALAPYPNVSVVLSTWWTPRVGHALSISMLPEGLQLRVVDDIFDDSKESCLVTGSSPLRVHLTLSAIHRRNNPRWLLLDNLTCRWPASVLRRAVRLHPANGLGSLGAVEHVKNLLKMLSNC